MKIITHTAKVIWLSFACLMISGCDDFLNVDQLGKNDIPGFFSNIEGLRQAKEGMHGLMYTLCDNYYTRYADVAGDMVRINVANASMWDQYLYQSLAENSAGAEGFIWRQGYTLLANANNIIKYAPAVQTNYPEYAQEVQTIYSEAFFARALGHLLLCNVYAQPYNYTADASHMGIPIALRIAEPNEMIGRSSVEQVYSAILSDISTALSGLGEVTAPDKESDSYYISARACKALQARVYLYMGRYELARDCASELIEIMNLTSYADYVPMMQLWYDDFPGVESILRLSGYGTNSHSLASYYFRSNNITTAGAADKLIESFVYAEDIRKSLVEADKEITKFMHPSLNPAPGEVVPPTSEIPYGVHLFRLSEMYLIRAEAFCQLGELTLAESDVKAIIARAIDTSPQNVSLSYSGKDELMEIIDRERVLEFFGEGHRLFDIVRRKQDMVRDADNVAAGQVVPIKMTYPNNKFVLPIPTLEITANDAIIQNPGY